MNQISQSKKWGITFLCAVIVMSMIVCSAIYVVDPYFQFRVRDNQYFMNTKYVDAGLVKNYDYDTVIIGSCMIQNYDISKFNSLLEVNAVKIGSAGLTPDGIIDYTLLANRVGKARNYYLNIDFISFGSKGDDEAIGLQEELNLNEYYYLLEDNMLSKLKYMFGYEAWFRFMPVDFGLIAYRAVGGNTSCGKIGTRTSIAHNGEWSDEYVYGEEAVMSRKNQEIVCLDETEKEELLQAMKADMDNFIDRIDFTQGSYTFIFPPYSYLFWEDAKAANTYEVYVEAKEYMIEKIKQRGGTVYDFQSIEKTHDLDYYTDTIHYSKYMNDYMIECMAAGEYKR